MDDAGEVIDEGPVRPGRTFFYGFDLRNESGSPVTVSGFEPNLTFTMDPARQGDRPDDHCLQFFETRSFDQRAHEQSYPQVIQPGETLRLYDNLTYHYIHGPVSNECQNGSIYYGAPTFQVEDVVTPPEDVDPPVSPVDPPVEPSDRVPTAPTPAVKVDTAR